MNGKELWEKVFNTDLEDAVLSHIDCEKNFDDEGTEEENKEIIDALEGYTIQDVVDWYLQYEGKGMYSTDLKYLIIDLLDIDDIEEIRGWE